MAVKEAVEEKKVDWIPAVGIGLGVAALGVGLYFYTKKAEFGRGDKISCNFMYEYMGPARDYVFRVTLGDQIGPIFNEFEETRQEFTHHLNEYENWQKMRSEVIYEVPKVLAPKKYDLEASIRYSTDRIVGGMRVIVSNIVVVK